MECFTPNRDSAAVFDLITRLSQIGIVGRDASYLASVEPYGSSDPIVRANYLAEFRFMVAPDKRAAAAGLVGLTDWVDPIGVDITAASRQSSRSIETG